MNLSLRYFIAFTAAILGCVSAVTAYNVSQNPEGSPSYVFRYDRPILGIDPGFFSGFDSAQKVEQNTSAKSERPTISAKSYLVGNINSGKVYLQKNSSQPMPVASMSKLVTAIAATDMLDEDLMIQIKEENLNVPPDSSYLVKDEKFKLGELLYPMLVSSSNVAAEAIADSMSDRQQFISTMVDYAKEIGMPKAYFADPSGLNPQNVASAEGMFALAKYLYKSRPDILEITKTKAKVIATSTDNTYHEVWSTHPFAGSTNFLGGKTGRTPEAGETMLTILEIEGQPIAFIVLGSYYGTREWDTRMLLEKYHSL